MKDCPGGFKARELIEKLVGVLYAPREPVTRSSDVGHDLKNMVLIFCLVS